MTQQKRNFLQETAFEEDVNLDTPQKTPQPPHYTQEMRKRWEENNKK